jgi:hypothetical protein
MTRSLCLALVTTVAIGLGHWTSLSGAQRIERQLERTFTVAAGSTVVVGITGGPNTVETGPGRSMQLTLAQRFRNVATDAEADQALRDYDVSAVQQGGTVTLTARRHRDADRGWRRGEPNVSFEATLTIPADVVLDLHTSGGPITVRGERSAGVKVQTSGGSITVAGGRADFDLDTSGGPIRVGRVMGNVIAHTSGGSITVDYVGPSATDVSLDTSGGAIRVGVDRAAKLDISASTSGGGVDVENLPFETRTIRRSRAVGTINGGGGRLTANTSGGSIAIKGL